MMNPADRPHSREERTERVASLSRVHTKNTEAQEHLTKTLGKERKQHRKSKGPYDIELSHPGRNGTRESTSRVPKIRSQKVGPNTGSEYELET